MAPQLFGYTKTILSVCVLLMTRLHGAGYPDHLISVQSEGVQIDTFVRSGVRYIKVGGSYEFSRGDIPVPMRLTSQDLLFFLHTVLDIRKCLEQNYYLQLTTCVNFHLK